MGQTPGKATSFSAQHSWVVLKATGVERLQNPPAPCAVGGGCGPPAPTDRRHQIAETLESGNEVSESDSTALAWHS